MKYIRTKMVIFTHAGIIEASTPLAAVAKDGFWEVACGQFKGTPIQQYQCESLITHEEYWNVKESLEKANRAISQMEQIIEQSSQNEVDKRVLIPLEVDRSIKLARMYGKTNAEMIQYAFLVYPPRYFIAARDFAANDFDLFIKALLVGYKTEEWNDENSTLTVLMLSRE